MRFQKARWSGISAESDSFKGDTHISKSPDVIVITGPTATGKSALGARVAAILGGEVVSADSMQVYKHMDIGTAKPSAAEMGGIPHHMIDVAEPWDDYSVAVYVKQAVPIVDDILRRNRIPVITGGTGLYIDSLIKGRVFAAAGDPRLRQELMRRYDDIGGRAMLDELGKADAINAGRLHENDKKRIVRAMEVSILTGKPLSAHDNDDKRLPARYNPLKIILSFSDREVLYGKIRRRVDCMMSKGLKDEVSSLLERGVSADATSMQAIGYKEIAAALRGDTTLTEAVLAVKMESTRYAKRQLTWLRRDSAAHRILWDDDVDIERAAAIAEGLFYEAK